MSEARQERLRLVERALEEREYLLGIQDVLGFAVGFREREGERTDQPVLTVFVRQGRKAKDPHDFPEHQRIPRRVRLSVAGETVWIPVDLVEREMGTLCGGGPLQAGLSVGNSRVSDNTGTIGWIARLDTVSREPVLCGAFHVLLRFGDSNLIGGADKRYRFEYPDFEEVLSPSPQDGGDADDAIGYVLAGRRNNVVDVALIAVSDPSRVQAVARGIGRLGAPRFLDSTDLDPDDPLEVRVSVRADEVRAGAVTRVKAVHPFAYPDRPDGLLLFDLIETDIASESGDSGGLLLDSDGRPLGMLVGRSGAHSYFMHIRHIIETMKLRDFRQS